MKSFELKKKVSWRTNGEMKKKLARLDTWQNDADFELWQNVFFDGKKGFFLLVLNFGFYFPHSKIRRWCQLQLIAAHPDP